MSAPGETISQKMKTLFLGLKRPWALAASLAAGIILIWVVVWLVFFNKPKTAEPVTAIASYADIEQTVLSTGVLVPFVEINVGSRASGLVTLLTVEIGDSVKKGEVIAQIDAASQSNGLMMAKAALLDSQAQSVSLQAGYDQSKAYYDRQLKLYEADAGSQADLELAIKSVKNARALISSVRAQIRQAEISVNTAQVNLGYTKIVAPIDGTVLSVVTKQGQTVNAAQIAPTIVTLGQLDRMTINAEIAEADVVHVSPGMVVYFTVLGSPEHRYYSALRSIQPAPTTFSSNAVSTTAISSAVYYYGIFDVDNRDGRLKTTMTANVSIVLAQALHVLTIPSSALGSRAVNGSYQVRVVGEDKKISNRTVMVGINDGTKAQLLSGLKEGEKVVLGQIDSLSPTSTSSSSSSSGARRSGAPRGASL